jgi:hypothetical protein
MSSGSKETIPKKKKKVLAQRRKEKALTARKSRKRICRQLLLQRQWGRSNSQSSRESRKEQGPADRLEHHGGTTNTNGIDHGLYCVLFLSFSVCFVVVVFFLLASVRIYSLSLFIHVSFTSPSYPNSIIIPFENEAIRPFPSSSLFLSSLSQFFFVYTIYFSSSATKSCHRVGFDLVFCFFIMC